MSILKAILHHYNSTSKAYDTLHPETESSQITDWHTALVNSLASSTLSAVVSTLSTDSVMGRLMKMLLTASGVKYSIGNNGYVCLGSFFGGLIIQWGTIILSSTSGYYDVSLPISVSTILQVYPVINNGSNSLGNFDGNVTIHSKSTSSFNVGVYQISTSSNVIGVDWIAVCK